MFIITLHTNNLLYITTFFALNYIGSNADLFKDGHFILMFEFLKVKLTIFQKPTRSCFEI